MVNMSENRSVVSRYAGWNCHTYESLVHIPVKASDDFYTIADVNNNANSITGDYVNLLCAVRKVCASDSVHAAGYNWTIILVAWFASGTSISMLLFGGGRCARM